MLCSNLESFEIRGICNLSPLTELENCVKQSQRGQQIVARMSRLLDKIKRFFKRGREEDDSNRERPQTVRYHVRFLFWFI